MLKIKRSETLGLLVRYTPDTCDADMNDDVRDQDMMFTA